MCRYTRLEVSPCEVSVDDAHRRLAAGDAVPHDVREAEEFLAGHVRGAVHVPLGELSERLAQLDRGRGYVAICRSGGRAAQATAYLTGLGYDVVNMGGGMKAWHAAGLAIEPEGGSIA